MDKEKVLVDAQRFAKEELGSDSSGHDFWHVLRVSEMAGHLAELESADTFVCRLTGLLHDIADEKLVKSEAEGQRKVKNWLVNHDIDQDTIEKIMEIINTMSFKGGSNPSIRTLEGQIVQDADRLDAIGAIGVARAFAYSGAKGQLIYNPEMTPRKIITKENYRNEQNTAINHFYEKLLKLKDMLNTTHAKKLAEERHQFMLDFLDQFYKEWKLNI